MICQTCGYRGNEEGEHRCARCGRRLDGRPAASPPAESIPPPAASVAVGGGQAGAAAAVAPEWRYEVSERLEQFRSKRAHRQPAPEPDESDEAVPPPDAAQKVLAFEDFAAERIEPVIVELPKTRPEPPPPAARPPITPPLGTPRQPARAPNHWRVERVQDEDGVAQEVLCPNPVAPLALRAVAGALDAAMAVIGVGVFATAFYMLGGGLPLTQRAWVTMGAAVAAVPAFYLFLYVFYAAETPGMLWTGLCVLDYDGYPPEPPKRLMRALGAVLSAAALGLGYIWALLDEESLTWHDRMSKTFVTRDPRAPRRFLPR